MTKMFRSEKFECGRTKHARHVLVAFRTEQKLTIIEMSETKINAEIDHSQDTFHAITATRSDRNLHDIRFKVGKVEFGANKVIIASRSSYWKQILKESTKEIHEINETTPDVFSDVLSYIYDGKLLIKKDMSAQWVSGIINLAEKYKLNRLTDKLINAIRVHRDGFWMLLKMANELKSQNLLEKCMDFADAQPNAVIDDPRFLDLSAEQLILIFQRSSFYCPEMELYSACRKWLQAHNNSHAKEVLACIRFENMSKNDLSAISTETSFVDSEKIEEAQIRQVKRRRISFRHCEYKAQLQGLTFTSSHDVNKKNVFNITENNSFKNAQDINLSQIFEMFDKCELLFKLPNICRINRIFVNLSNESKFSDKLITSNAGEFCYLIEISSDAEKWTTVSKRVKDCCQGVQHIYFRAEVAQFIRISAFDWVNKGRRYFWSWLEYIFKSGFFTITCSLEATLLRAEKSMLPEYKNFAQFKSGTQLFVCDAKVIESCLLQAIPVEQKYKSPCVLRFLSFAEDNFIDIVFSQQFNIDSIRFLLYDKDSTTYDYKVYIATDHTDIYFDVNNHGANRRPGKSDKWIQVAESNNTNGWQLVTFQTQPVAVVSIQCLSVKTNLSNKDFRIVHIECSSSQKDIFN
ncbi:BTB/POZ domain-containing protein 9-like protein [Leptotrombidium deliense]|uniref:BTB/POZ domain-containing protein 9-like protein n=1 Tax=Leptotrombidium deliense TaxID=299467 RepID=A0A443SMJ5_9ACAR|nr:BTB/POZ domain-containing protein 9-like protein [Leptotrombidium deliense]